MLIHASCVARDGDGVLLLGPPGSGKSDLAFRLLDRGFSLVADDQVVIADGMASAPDSLAGLLELRGLGIFELPFLPSARLALVVRLERGERLPEPQIFAPLGLPLVRIDPAAASAPARVALALDAALGGVAQLVGAFRKVAA